MELEEYNYAVKYVRGVDNVKADALSRNCAASPNQPPSRFDDFVYSVFGGRERFLHQLQEEQDADPVINSAKECVARGEKISSGRLKRVQKQLRVEDGVLQKSGRPVVPASLRYYVTSQLHGTGHFGSDKTYALVKSRFFWPGMYSYIQNFTASCKECQQSKCDTRPPKAPIIPMLIPEGPMQFISLDIAYMPVDTDGYRYVLLAGDIFSKYIHAIPLRDQSAAAIIRAFETSWLFMHGNPFYILSDQGSNVDGEVIHEFCEYFGIEKRRSSAYHSAGNGFAERNIRSIREILRSALLESKLHQTKWRKLLPSLVFALNCSISRATKCVPYTVVFGREPTLPVDVLLGSRFANKDVVSPSEYVQELEISLKSVWDSVLKHLNISKQEMMSQYNKNLRFHDHLPGSKVWLKAKYIKSGENKLAPKRSGPWTVIEKLPNGVNFRIRNDKSRETKVVHHDRLKAVRENPLVRERSPDEESLPPFGGEESGGDKESSSVASFGDESDYSPSESTSDDSGPDADDEIQPDDSGADADEGRRYPVRQRRQAVIPGAIPWDAVPL